MASTTTDGHRAMSVKALKKGEDMSRRNCYVRKTNDGELAVGTPYDPKFLTELKRYVPVHQRRFDGATREWIVSSNNVAVVGDIIKRVYGQSVALPEVVHHTSVTRTDTYEVRYIGRAKERDGTPATSYGFCNGEWMIVLPESVMRAWFNEPQSEATPRSLYGVLGVAPKSSVDEIKSAFRRMARQWHPDVCKEQGAAERFIRIREASDVLMDEGKRARYDAGLALEAIAQMPAPKGKQKRTSSVSFESMYAPPMRCGVLTVTGKFSLNRFVVDKIEAWAEITRDGKTLVTSWPVGAETFIEEWV